MTTKLGLLVRLVAKPGGEADVQKFITGALPLAQQEAGTTAWFAIKLSDQEFGIFDAFPDEAARNAHLNGPIAKALMENASALLSEAPRIEKVEVLAAKLPG